jgi:fucose permease
MTTDAMDARAARVTRWLTCLMFFTFAMTTDAVGSVIPSVIREYHLSLTAAGAFQYATMAGIAAGALLLGFLADRLGRRRTIVLGLLLYGVASLLMTVSSRFGLLVALLGLGGLGVSVFKTAALALIGDITPSTRAHTRFMNTVEGWFAVGAIVGPAIVATLLSRDLSWRWLYCVAAVICLGLVVMTSQAAEAPRRGVVERANLAQMGRVLRDPVALGFSLLIALYVAVEVAIYVWMPTYLEGYDGSQAWLRTWALTLFFVLRAVGRFIGAWVLDRVSWTRALVVMGAAIFACFAGALFGGLRLGVWLLPATGLFMSIVYPTLNSKAISSFPRHEHGAAAGVILCFTALAAAIGPLCMGLASDHWGTPRAGFVLATVFAALLLVGLIVNVVRDPSRHRLQRADDAAPLPG